MIRDRAGFRVRRSAAPSERAVSKRGAVADLPGARVRRASFGVHLASALLVLAVAVSGAGCGGEREAVEQTPAPVDSSDIGRPDLFGAMRPAAGDKMVRPHVEFRWTFDAAAAGADSVEGFVVHVRGFEAAETIIRSDSLRAYVTLDPTFPPGECEWWVVAELAGRAGVRSPTETFTLLP